MFLEDMPDNILNFNSAEKSRTIHKRWQVCKDVYLWKILQNSLHDQWKDNAENEDYLPHPLKKGINYYVILFHKLNNSSSLQPSCYVAP